MLMVFRSLFSKQKQIDFVFMYNYGKGLSAVLKSANLS